MRHVARRGITIDPGFIPDNWQKSENGRILDAIEPFRTFRATLWVCLVGEFLSYEISGGRQSEIKVSRSKPAKGWDSR